MTRLRIQHAGVGSHVVVVAVVGPMRNWRTVTREDRFEKARACPSRWIFALRQEAARYAWALH